MARPKKVTESEDPHRNLFHNKEGGLELSRLVEQLIPSIVIGVIVTFANFKVIESQVGDLRKELERASLADVERQRQLQNQSEKLAGLNAQISGFLSQQVAVNAGLDARMIYMERRR